MDAAVDAAEDVVQHAEDAHGLPWGSGSVVQLHIVAAALAVA